MKQPKARYVKTCPRHRFYRIGSLLFSFKHCHRDVNLYTEIEGQHKRSFLVIGAVIPADAEKITEQEFNRAL